MSTKGNAYLERLGKLIFINVRRPQLDNPLLEHLRDIYRNVTRISWIVRDLSFSKACVTEPPSTPGVPTIVVVFWNIGGWR